MRAVSGLEEYWRVESEVRGKVQRIKLLIGQLEAAMSKEQQNDEQNTTSNGRSVARW